jgi:IS5 family transposase
MGRVVPWSALCARIEAFYPKPGNGRPPVGAERMLRIFFLQQWFNLSDPAVEEALYDSLAMRGFVGIDVGREPVPDETTVAASATCWRSTIWAGRYSTRFSGTWPQRV